MAIAARPVPPADIQSALDKIWESLKTTNTTRACLFNLILYTQKDSRILYVQRLAQRVVEKFPSRVIFVTADKNSKEDSLKTEVSILTSSKGEFDVACDYIQMEASGASLEKIPFVILPHILPDLPIYLLMAEDPSKEDPLFNQIEHFANRVIFDSEATENLPLFAASVLEHQKKSKADIADLNWARIDSWREMLTRVFYSADRLKQIERVQKIDITYNSQETQFFCHTKIQAFYLQAWLACQLGWKFQSTRTQDKTFSLTYQTAAGPIEITLTSVQHTNLPPGIVLSFDLHTSQNEHFAFQRNHEALHQITFQYSTQTECSLPYQYIFPRAEAGHSLVKEITHRGTSQHFARVLNLIKTMETHFAC